MNPKDKSTYRRVRHLSASLREMSPEIREKVKLFNSSVKLLLDPLECNTYKILPIINGYLYRFKLSSYYDPRDIFQEAYLRGVQKLIDGETIEFIPGWIKITAYYIIREKSKDTKQQESLINRLQRHDVESTAVGNELLVDNAIDVNIKALQISIKNLSATDYKILELHIVEGLSWKEIGEYLVSIGEETQNSNLTARLRKRGQRALERLRQNYYKSIQSRECKSLEG